MPLSNSRINPHHFISRYYILKRINQELADIVGCYTFMFVSNRQT
jgi:hypothetical protein